MIAHRYPRICVFAGSAGNLPAPYTQVAAQLGALMASRSIHLVYGGGKTGLMGAVADGVLQAGGEVTGIVPESLFQPQLIHSDLTRLEILPDIHQRKARMSELACAFIALPGGFGTLDELFETLTWSQIGIHRKPVGILNIGGYYNPLITMIETACREGFIYPEHKLLLVVSDEPEDLLDQLHQYQFPEGIDRWVDRPED